MTTTIPDDIQEYAGLFHAGDFHAAHDALEPRWTRTRAHTLHGLIQWAVGWHHLSNDNLHGARVLWTKALAHLEHAGGEHNEGVDLASVRMHVRRALNALPPGRRWEGPLFAGLAAPRIPFTEGDMMNGQLSLVLQELETLKSQREDLWNITWDTGQFLRVLALAMKATRILEIGMSNGFSTLWWAGAAQANGGTVTTLEREDYKVKEASENFRRAGVADVIRIIHGDAHATLPTLEGPWDIVFIDAAKGQDPVDYLNIVAPRIRKGGVIIADNATSHAETMAAYLQAVRAHPDFESVLLPIGNGEEVSVRK